MLCLECLLVLKLLLLLLLEKVSRLGETLVGGVLWEAKALLHHVLLLLLGLTVEA